MVTKKTEVVEEVVKPKVVDEPVVEYFTVDTSLDADVADVHKAEDVPHLLLNDKQYALSLKQ